MSSKELKTIIDKSGLVGNKADYILRQFQDYFKIASDWEEKAKTLKVTDSSQFVEMSNARTGRLFLREKRIAVERARKQLKEQSVMEGKAIDGIANVLKALIIPIEKYLDEQEHFVEIRAKKKAEAERIEAEKKAEEKAEADRLETERKEKETREAERKEAEKQRLENEELRKQAKQREEKARQEREKSLEKERKLKAIAAKKEKAAKDAYYREKKAQDEIEKIKKNTISCPNCGHKIQLKEAINNAE